MTRYPPCSCGYQANSAEDLGDHLADAFTPPDDKATDGQVHAEAAGPVGAGTAGAHAPSCLCGYLAGDIAMLDEHLLAAFTPGDAIDRAGVRHSLPVEP